MRYLCSIGLLIVGAVPIGIAQSAEIQWRAARALTWDDFEGRVPSGAAGFRVASTTSSIAWTYAYSIEWSPQRCVYTITQLGSVALFDPGTSWVRPGHRNAEILEHEQGHFDIAQIYSEEFNAAARRLLDAERQCEGRNKRRASENAEREIARLVDSLYSDVWQRFQDRQNAYDGETNHGIDRTAQAQWTRRIADSLQPARDR